METTKQIRQQTIDETEQIHAKVMHEPIKESEKRPAQEKADLQNKYEKTVQDMLDDKELTLRQAKQIIQETEAQSQAKAQQEFGRLATWAEEQHAQNAERIRQQVMAEAEASHHRMKNKI